ncbi:MAG: glycosyltransferase [Micavibrio aeruginosavorus]|uniref:Glycosyltransferase n=1 Tax=Micavibrio aeruginosavorus TaxID=349221 RepID=A0A2W5PZD3_9BACT|nr:MAG: glycosyltransferase [Micavibrio aeruginosavorus]
MSVLDKLKDPQRVYNYLYWRVRDFIQYFENWAALLRIKKTSREPFETKPHGRKEEVIISLTSYPKRFGTLHWTLECLTRQTVKADRVIVWLYEPDMAHITPEMRALESRNVEFRAAPEDYKSFKKIFYTLTTFPNAIIITVDDDMYYKPTMLEELIEAWSGDYKEIVCHYGVRIPVDASGKKRPFREWKEIRGPLADALDVMPYGFGGVLYPPGALPPQTLNTADFKRLCPHADDVWLYWMARMNGCRYRKAPKDVKVLEWPSTQASGLKNQNMGWRNDEQIDKMAKEYGWPSFETA